MAQISLDEYNRRLEELSHIASERIAERIVVPAANKLLATIKNRIQQEGKATNGSPIGHYSTRPGYFTKDAFVQKSAFKGRGKGGFKGERLVSTRQYKAVKMKNGKERLVSEKKYKVVKKALKSMYLEEGYKELREIQGRPVDKMNFTYAGDLMLSYQMRANAEYVLLGLTSNTEARKREGLEFRFGKVLTGGAAELDAYKEEVNEGFKDLTTNLLNRI